MYVSFDVLFSFRIENRNKFNFGFNETRKRYIIVASSLELFSLGGWTSSEGWRREGGKKLM